MSKGEGEIILGRRYEGETFVLADYGPCPKCFEWIRRSVMGRHQKVCPCTSDKLQAKGALLTQSDVISGRINEKASSLLTNEVFTILKSDEIGNIARNDALIVAIGNQWIQKLRGNTVNRKYYTSGIMRLCAKLLKDLRKTAVVSLEDKEENTMADYLRPQHFDRIVQSAYVCSHQDTADIEELGSPSNALKLGYEIRRLVNTKLGCSIRECEGRM